MTVEGVAQYRPYISDEMAESLLHDLVATPSFSGEEGAAARLLVDWMMAQGGYDEAFIDGAGNAVGVIGEGPRMVVLLGHIDTFGGQPPVRVEGRRLYGRGTVDAKGPLCAFAIAARRANLPRDVRVVVIGAVEEEAPSSRGAHFVVDQYQPEACVIGEPSGWDRITLGYKGNLQMSWSWEGPLAHSAGEAATPAERAFACWAGVQRMAEAHNADCAALFDRLDAALLSVNSEADGLLGRARMRTSFRLPPGLPSAAVAEKLDAGDGDLRIVSEVEAFAAERDTTVSRALRGAIRAAGGRPRFVHKTGTSDMNIVGPRWGCPIIAYGPGDSALDHTPDEHIDLDEYLRAIDVLRDALARLGAN